MNRFFTVVEGTYNYLEFSMISSKVMELKHLHINDSLGNSGLASDILHDVFIYSQKDGYQITTRCEAINDYIRKHPEFNCILLKEAVY